MVKLYYIMLTSIKKKYILLLEKEKKLMIQKSK